jgi:hypothetical protein
MLPQRRKSAEEIAKLRESLGIPGETPQEEASAEPDDPGHAEAPPAPNSTTAPEETVPVAATPEKREHPSPPAKPVRSLRKSELKPERPPLSPVETKYGIPLRRHDDRELQELRRIQATPPDQSIAYIHQLAAPWPLVMLAYLLPFTGAILGWFAAWSPTVPEPSFPALWLADLSRAPWLGQAGFVALAGCCALGLAAAGWLAWKKPRSRHHAGFITIFAVLIAVFGIIHQFDPTHGP